MSENNNVVTVDNVDVVAANTVPQAPAERSTQLTAEQRLAQLEREMQSIQEHKAKLLELQRKEDRLAAQMELLGFLGGQVAVAIEFPLAKANELIPFDAVRMHVVYSDDANVFYAEAPLRYWVTERSLVCAVGKNTHDVLDVNTPIEVVTRTMDIVVSCTAENTGIRVVDLPVGSWEVKRGDVTSYVMPTKTRSWIRLARTGSFLGKRGEPEAEYLMFADSLYKNPEFQRVFNIGDIRFMLK